MISLKNFNSKKIANCQLSNVYGGKAIKSTHVGSWVDTRDGYDETRTTRTYYEDGQICSLTEFNNCP